MLSLRPSSIIDITRMQLYSDGMQILLPGLKPLRKAAGLSQQQLAEQSGLSIGTISKHEQGVINGVDGDTLDALCMVLRCERHDLFCQITRTHPSYL